MHLNLGAHIGVLKSISEVNIMSGPITNYKLGKMTHREYEAKASEYWRQHLAGEDESIPAKRSGRLLERSASGLHRVWCATARVGLSPAGCQAIE
jgi:hypothetical protein